MKTLLLGLLLTVLPLSAQSASTNSNASASQRATAPDFTLKALSGVNLRLAEQRGDIIVLNFWASWCGPCIQEMPELDKLARK